jgi:hypothetical protein
VLARIEYSSERTPERSGGRSSDRNADVAQLVEHHLAKVRVAGSNPVVRSEAWLGGKFGRGFKHAPAAEWPSGLGKGLQSPVHGFDSRLRLSHLCDQRKHPFRVCTGRMTVLAIRSCASSLGAQDMRAVTVRGVAVGPRDVFGDMNERSASSGSSRGRPGIPRARFDRRRGSIPAASRGGALPALLVLVVFHFGVDDRPFPGCRDSTVAPIAGKADSSPTRSRHAPATARAR